MIVCALVNVGMWFERFVIIVISLSRDFLPSSWHWYFPSYVEVLTLMGSFGLFSTLFLLFCRYLPIVAMAEVKGVLPQANAHNTTGEPNPSPLSAGADGVGESTKGLCHECDNSDSQALGPSRGSRGSYGLLAEYSTPSEVLHAAEKVRDAGYEKWDCLTPFPVRMDSDHAMGMKKTILPWLVLACGLTGFSLAIFMQWYVNSPHTQSAALVAIFQDTALNISGKPYWSLPPNVPIIFELTAVLLSSLGAFFSVWGLSGLPPRFPSSSVFNVARFRRALTDDKFFVLIEAADMKFDPRESFGGASGIDASGGDRRSEGLTRMSKVVIAGIVLTLMVLGLLPFVLIPCARAPSQKREPSAASRTGHGQAAEIRAAAARNADVRGQTGDAAADRRDRGAGRHDGPRRDSQRRGQSARDRSGRRKRHDSTY